METITPFGAGPSPGIGQRMYLFAGAQPARLDIHVFFRAVPPARATFAKNKSHPRALDARGIQDMDVA
jgi:hypothetical protein